MRKIYEYNEELYSKDSPEAMYFLGLVASDGCIDGYHIKIALDKKDSELLLQLVNSICPNKPLYKSRDLLVLKISCKPIMSFVKTAGITERKSLTLKLNDWVLQSPNFKHFIRGYFDGDGTIVLEKANKKIRSKGAVKIISGSKDILSQMSEKLAEYGMNKNKIYKEGKYFLMKYTCGQINKFYEIIYKDGIKLQRKYDKFNAILALLRRQI